uniref:Putative signal transduction protein with CBS domains n=1 Tax=Magnetococcus massalia (strain MO-1) TaxID=451514 RepID=A0A1S7LD73_MAGMO|nr:Putative signal transduction protein with CBS domains [Candidatus Magnetococcus massalia]
MYIDRIMKRDVVSVAPEATLSEMAEVMRNHHFRHLPVVDGGRLVGVVSRQDILRAEPSPVSTLSAGEAKYLLSKVTAKEIMQSEVIECGPKTLIEEAGWLMRHHRVGFLPVLSDGQLQGVVTTDDLMDFFLDVTGCNVRDSARIALHLADETGRLSEMLQQINKLGGYIATVVSPTHPDETGKRIAIVRYRHDDPQVVADKLTEMGYHIITEDLEESGHV